MLIGHLSNLVGPSSLEMECLSLVWAPNGCESVWHYGYCQ